MQSPFNTYLSDMAKTRAASASVGMRDNEHPHRPALKILLEFVLSGVQAVNDPGKTEFGAIDFALVKDNYPIGYVETKRPGEDLDDIAKGEQMKRYFGYANLILTNYLEFRFYKHGEQYCDAITIADLATLTLDQNASTLLESTLNAFLEDAAEPVRRAGTLAKIMGENAKRIRGNLIRFLKTENNKNKPILDIYNAFKLQLIHDLSLEDFADMYAQTLVYGLFVARYHDETSHDFSRQEARDLIPHTNPLLRRFFDHIAGADFDVRLAPIVDELCAVFLRSNVRELMQQLYKQDLWGIEHVSPDPVIHFYEDFLKNYDAQQRKKLGAYYTPPAVVHFIVRSVDAILKRDFDLPAGLVDTKKISIVREVQNQRHKEDIHKVQVLDPAVGTGTFLNEVVRLIRRSFTGQEGRFGNYAQEDLLPRLHGFELMMAPYTIAHLKLAATLRESGAKEFKDRIGVYLTNSLEKADTNDGTLFASLGLAQSISDESRAATRIKNNTPIMVVIGNPPYAGESSNKNYTGHDVYKVEPGTNQKLKERNSKWINDDYVKFIRLAESLVEKTGEGIVAMITAHGYLDNPTFRGMRYHLMQTFDAIYVLDLHGNANKKEKAPDGSKDENVFAIKQGVAILIGIKRKDKHNKLATIFRADCFGSRRNKFIELNDMELTSDAWKEIHPQAPMFFFAHQGEHGKTEYEKGFRLDEAYSQFSTGLLTKNDKVAISFQENNLWANIEKFNIESEGHLRSHFDLKKDSRDWVLRRAMDDVRQHFSRENVVSLSYRPFDSRYTYYTGTSRGFMAYSQMRVMRNIFNKNNYALISGRQGQAVGSMPWNLIFMAKDIVDLNIFYRGGGTIFPLYLYAEDGSRVPNLNKDIVKQIAAGIGSEPTPEDIFDYIYAVLHSPSYREKYKEFLKTDFPRVPYPSDKAQFDALVALGRELRGLHLLESPKVRQFITTYPVDGSNKIDKIKYADGKVFINQTQYFGSVPESTWQFYIGGYQPAQKWLKDRMGRTLTSTDIEHYQKMIVALAETHRLMGEINKVAIY